MKYCGIAGFLLCLINGMAKEFCCTAALWIGEATVYVNGQKLGTHQGGYDPFSLDITDALKASGSQELMISVWDPTSKGTQPRGKQVINPRGIWYTPVTGIWQTVWLEPVPDQAIASLKITPDIDKEQLIVKVLGSKTLPRRL